MKRSVKEVGEISETKKKREKKKKSNLNFSHIVLKKIGISIHAVPSFPLSFVMRKLASLITTRSM